MSYVYVLLDPRKPGCYCYGDFVFDFLPFYVGKANDLTRRPYQHFSLSPKHPELNLRLGRILRQTKSYAVVATASSNVTEETAYKIEAKVISLIGRQDLGLGPLLNRTNGGEGKKGSAQTESTKQKISAARSLALTELRLTDEDEWSRKLSAMRKGLSSYYDRVTKEELTSRAMKGVATRKSSGVEALAVARATATKAAKREEILQRLVKAHKELLKGSELTYVSGFKTLWGYANYRCKVHGKLQIRPKFVESRLQGVFCTSCRRELVNAAQRGRLK